MGRNATSRAVFVSTMRTLLAFAGAALLTSVCGCAVQAQVGDPYPYPPAGAVGYGDPGQYDDRPGYNEYAEAGDYRRPLDPYGQWVDDRTYGRVWRPYVAAGWAPYTDGYWGWSNWGWSWIATGPWAWTFHYGRWVSLPSFGWAWYPGSVWGPAWVDWHAGDGWIAWAPLAPFGVVSFNNYIYVNERNFCSPNLRRVVVRDRDVPDHVRRDVYERRIVRAPDRGYIQRVARDPIRTFDRGDRNDRFVNRRDDGPSRRIERRDDDGGSRRFERRDDDGPSRRVERRDQDNNAGRRFDRPGRPFDDRRPDGFANRRDDDPSGRITPPRVYRPADRNLGENVGEPRRRMENGGGYRTPMMPDDRTERRLRRDSDNAPGRMEPRQGFVDQGAPRAGRRVERAPRGPERVEQMPSTNFAPRSIERAPSAGMGGGFGGGRSSGSSFADEGGQRRRMIIRR